MSDLSNIPGGQGNGSGAGQNSPESGAGSYPNYLALPRIPKKTMQQIQDLQNGDKDLIHEFNEMLYYLFNNLTNDLRYKPNEIGAGYLMADLYRPKLRYVKEKNAWFKYDGRKWKSDDAAAMEYCKQLAQILEILLDAVQYQYKQMYKEPLKEVTKFVAKWQTRRGREGVLKDAATVHPIEVSEFDKNPYLLNCRNGTLDLRNMVFHPHNPDDLFTKMANVTYDPNAGCARWERHIFEVMKGDQVKALFLQQALGYALTGMTNFECFFILFGPTSRNGKGLTMGTFATLMGDYAVNAQPDTITQKQTANGSGPSEDLARLAGARFINISEPDKKMVLSSARVKTLTGNDLITARYLHENSFEFRLSGKIFINTNHLPTVTDTTVFNSDRVKVIPFERHFEPHEQDKNLKAFLTQPANLSGILNWCLVGLQNLQKNGFVDCPSVQLATQDYEQDSDRLGTFICDMLEESPGSELFTENVYAAYRSWCENNGYRYGSQSTFKKDMASRAQIQRKRPSGQPQANPRSLIIGFKFKPIHQPMNQIPPNYSIATGESET